MTIKAPQKAKPKPSTPKKTATDEAIEALGNSADGAVVEEKKVVTSFNLPKTLLYRLEDLATNNRREKRGLHSMSAVVQIALEEYFENNPQP